MRSASREEHRHSFEQATGEKRIHLGNFMRTLAMPKTAEPWSLTSLREKLVKIGAKVVGHGRYVTFQMAEVGRDRCSRKLSR